MNLNKLKEAEASFLLRYPKGFKDPALEPIKKKHNVDKVIRFAQENLSEANCAKPQHVAAALVTIVSQSSMVSRFEKPQFKHFIDALDSHEKEALASAVYHRLHGKKQHGFEQMCGMMAHHKVAKWPVITSIPFYYAPRREVFVKPTTAKNIIAYLEHEELNYGATPTWAFYRGYQRLIADIRREVPRSLSPNNAALTGFLMMAM